MYEGGTNKKTILKKEMSTFFICSLKHHHDHHGKAKRGVKYLDMNMRRVDFNTGRALTLSLTEELLIRIFISS